jgi:hypothetical protein
VIACSADILIAISVDVWLKGTEMFGVAEAEVEWRKSIKTRPGDASRAYPRDSPSLG